MKAGIAIAMLAMRALLEEAGPPAARVVMLWTSDEERGSQTSRGLVEDEARRSDAVLVLEPSLPGGALKTARKGCGEFELRVGGVPAHAGIEPEKGASAVHEIARQILAIESLRDHERGVSVNVGVVEGGSRPNVVAPQARAVIDIRVSTASDRDRVDQAVRSLVPQLEGTTVEVTGGFSRPPLERTDERHRSVHDSAGTRGRVRSRPRRGFNRWRFRRKPDGRSGCADVGWPGCGR